MALDIITASEGGIYAIIQAECCMFTSDEFVNVSSLLNHMRTQVNALNEPISSLCDLVNQWFGSWGSWWKKLLLILRIIVCICVLSCMRLYSCCGIYLQCSQTAAKRATSMVIKPLADYSETLQKRRMYNIIRVGWRVRGGP